MEAMKTPGAKAAPNVLLVTLGALPMRVPLLQRRDCSRAGFRELFWFHMDSNDLIRPHRFTATPWSSTEGKGIKALRFGKL
jgi:hypothetical protein